MTTSSHTDQSTTCAAAARRFPLLGRPRPGCPALPDRVAEIAELAAATSRPDATAMETAAHVLNTAALIASDCGLHELATQWCWRHINCYRHHGTRTVLQAGYLLEPVLNLARLQIRARLGEPALRLLHDMHHAIASGTDLVVGDHTLPLTNLTGTRDERRKLHEWAWLQYLSEGVRILALNNRWDDATTHATQLNGIGLHLMDGRQAAILAHCLRGAPHLGRELLDASTITEPWEHQVGACLTVMCSTPTDIDQHTAAMVEQFLAIDPTPEYVVYQTRLGLTVATLAANHHTAAAQHVLNLTAQHAIEARDGYASRDILQHHTSLHLATRQHEALAQLVSDAGLGATTMPATLRATLDDAVRTAALRLAETLKTEPAATAVT